MTEETQHNDAARRAEAIEALFAPAGGGSSEPPEFTIAFRGYDKTEVDAAFEHLSKRLENTVHELASLREQQKAAAAELTDQKRRLAEEAENERSDVRAELDQLRAELATEQARAAKAEQQVQTLTDELTGTEGESAGKAKFEEILRVAEDQAGALTRNASAQAERLLEMAREEIAQRKQDAKAEADLLLSQAEQDAQQLRLRMESEYTAHEARIEREAAHAAEKVAQAEQEANAIRTEAERGAAALRAAVSREVSEAQAEADELVRERRARALELEESVTRRQDEAQQEFLMLHNQAVAHAERITQDANEQVAASVEHAKRISLKAEDFERSMRAQAQQIEADAKLKAREHLERAQLRAQKIVDTVTDQTQSVLRDAEDRARQLRWQQQQLTGFMAEIRELIRPEGPLGVDEADTAAVLDADDIDLREAAEPGQEDAEPLDSDPQP